MSVNSVWAINVRSWEVRQVVKRMQEERLLLHSQFLFEALIRAGCTPRTFRRIRIAWLETYFDHPPVVHSADYLVRHLADFRRKCLAQGKKRRKWVNIARRHFEKFYDRYAERILEGTWRPPQERTPVGLELERKIREVEELQSVAAERPAWGLGTNRRRSVGLR